MKKYILVIILFFIFAFNIKAECNDKELLTYAKNVEIKYKELESEDNRYIYYLYVDPKRDDIELKSTNSLYSGVTNSVEMEGNLVIPSGVHYEEKIYNIDIYVKDNSSVCAGELLTSLTYTVPPYNEYVNTQFCENNPDLDICQRMADTKEMSDEEFAIKAQEYEEEKIQKEKGLLYIIFFDYLIWIIVPAIIFGIVYYRRIKQVKKVKENE